MSILNYFSVVLTYFLLILLCVCWILVIVKFMKNKYASVKRVKAVVFDKYTTKPLLKTQGVFKRENHIIVFLVGDKKLSFNVSEFSYKNYKLKEKGMLKYKGNRLIDFS